EHAFANHWVAPPDLDEPIQQLPVETLCAEFEEAGLFEVRDAGGSVRTIRCVRPWRIEVSKPPAQVLTTSNSHLLWRSQIFPQGADARLRFDPPPGWAWAGFLCEVQFFTHSHHSHAEVRRFAVGARANLRFQGGAGLDADIRYTQREDGEPAAVG